MDDTKFDSRRRLCPDGSCIGVIGPNGRCSECGRAPGDAAEAPAPSTDTPDNDGNEDAVGASSANEGAETTSADSGFNAARRLCDDGSCLGIIGPDGRCNVCGTKAA